MQKGRRYDVCSVNRAAEMETESRSADKKLWKTLSFYSGRNGKPLEGFKQRETGLTVIGIVLGSLAGYSP